MGIETSPGEEVVAHLRTHPKALIGPVLALFVFTAGLGVGVAAMPTAWQPFGLWALVALYLLACAWIVIAPFLRWLTTTFTLTNRRVVTRHGILNRRGHDLPLARVNNVNYESSLTDRMFGCGTLILETAAGAPLVLNDVPGVRQVHQSVNELLFYDFDAQATRGRQ